MKKVFFLLFLVCNVLLGQENRYVHTNLEFKIGSTEYLFGDNVKLRSAPTTDSEVLELLKIDAALEIVQKTRESLIYNGRDSYWYKVKYNEKIGYVLGGLIALDRKKIGDVVYLISIKTEQDRDILNTRYLKEGQAYNELASILTTSDFRVEVSKGRGLEAVENIIHINYLAEACGAEGGGIYLFNDGSKLFKAFEYSQISDASVFWYDEEYIFPEDEKGVPGKIVYNSESGISIDEATNWVEIKTIKRELEWKNRQLIPNPKTESK